jgi:uncharacterized membrane protein
MEFKPMPYYFAFFLFFTLLFSACGKIENSNSLDDLQYNEVTVAGSDTFLAVRKVLVSKCFSCHTHAAWKSYSETDFFQKGLAVSGSLSGSKIYFRLTTAIYGNGPKDMPQAGSPSLTESETQQVADWISGI